MNSEFYNILISGNCDAWNESTGSFPGERIFEYTSDDIKAAFSMSAGTPDFRKLAELPTILANEVGCKRAARVVQITKVTGTPRSYLIHYSSHPDFREIAEDNLYSLEWELQLHDFEKHRTHWAVKRGNLASILAEAGYGVNFDKLGPRAALAIPVPSSIDRDQCSEPVLQLFVSYSHADLPFLERLMVHLRSLRGIVQVNGWADTDLSVGDKWRDEIRQAVARCDAAILIISADFLASDFIATNELPPLLAAAQGRGVRVMPMIAKPCRFTSHPELSSFQAANDPTSSLILLSEGHREEVYDRIAQAVVQMAKNRSRD